jgi:hypothetical protein
MAIFGEERRIINEADDTLPFITPGFEPGPGHYKNEIQTRLTTALEVQAARPGERRSTFGITERHRGPWSYIGDPKKLAEVAPGQFTMSTQLKKNIEYFRIDIRIL